MKVIEVVKRCSKNTSVVTDTGIHVRVPAELGKLGIELDDLRVILIKSSTSKSKYRYSSLNSSKYKCIYAEKYSFQLKDEDWFEFERLSKWYLKKFFRLGWIRGNQFDDWLDEWYDGAYRSGVHYRMAQMEPTHRRRFMYAHVKGFLCRSIEKKVREPKMVSFEVLESMEML